MKYECVGREGQKLASRAKVWSALSTPTWILSILQCKKNCFPLEADQFHPFKRVAVFGEGINNKFHFDVDRAADVVGDACCRKAVDQFK